MAIYDNDGMVNSEIMAIYDNDGTTNYLICGDAGDISDAVLVGSTNRDYLKNNDTVFTKMVEVPNTYSSCIVSTSVHADLTTGAYATVTCSEGEVIRLGSYDYQFTNDASKGARQIHYVDKVTGLSEGTTIAVTVGGGGRYGLSVHVVGIE